MSSHRIDKWFKDFEQYLQEEERALSVLTTQIVHSMQTRVDLLWVAGYAILS